MTVLSLKMCFMRRYHLARKENILHLSRNQPNTAEKVWRKETRDLIKCDAAFFTTISFSKTRFSIFVSCVWWWFLIEAVHLIYQSLAACLPLNVSWSQHAIWIFIHEQEAGRTHCQPAWLCDMQLSPWKLWESPDSFQDKILSHGFQSFSAVVIMMPIKVSSL